MKWIDTAERKFGHLAVPHLIRTVAILNGFVFVLYKLNPSFLKWLTLDPEAVMRGEFWRLASYVLIPSIGGPLFDWLGVALYIYYIWWVGDGLEEAMGSFRVNLFYFVGVIGTTVAAFFGDTTNFATVMLNSSLFFAFARFYPEVMIYLMALVPVKVKWLAWVSGFVLVAQFVFGGWDFRLAVLAAFANYFLFFGGDIVHEALHRREVADRRRRFEQARLPEDESLHRCEVCGRTEQTAPELEFRVAKDGHEYCSEHLPKAPVAS